MTLWQIKQLFKIKKECGYSKHFRENQRLHYTEVPHRFPDNASSDPVAEVLQDLRLRFQAFLFGAVTQLR